MEYLVILALSLYEEPELKFYNYRSVKFNDQQTCEIFITSKQKQLKESIRFQFNQNNKVESYAITCWSSEEWNKYLDSIFEMNI
jgi:hypothetical protein